MERHPWAAGTNNVPLPTATQFEPLRGFKKRACFLKSFRGWYDLVCGGTVTGRGLTFHGGTQNVIDACLIASALGLEPVQYVGVKADAELLLGRGPGRR